MRQTSLKILILSILTSCSIVSKGQISQIDSASIGKTIVIFYDWYVKSINSNLHAEYSPAFVKKSDGMTTLDFSKYVNNLKKYNFHYQLIEKSVKSFDPCLNNLNKLSFEKFSQFEDLDQYEEIKCDFNNYYQWTSDMDRIDGVEICELSKTNSEEVSVVIKFYNLGIDKITRSYWNHKRGKITMIKSGKVWKIKDLNIQLTNK